MGLKDPKTIRLEVAVVGCIVTSIGIGIWSVPAGVVTFGLLLIGSSVVGEICDAVRSRDRGTNQ